MTEMKAPSRRRAAVDPDEAKAALGEAYVSPIRADADIVLEAESDASLVAAAARVFEDDFIETPDIKAALATVQPLGDGRSVDTATGEVLAATEEAHGAVADQAMTPRFAPKKTDIIRVDGGDYLTVRRRLMWMRGNPGEHPNWGVHTQLLKFDMGTWDGVKKVRGGKPDVKGGYAIVHAEVVDEFGRVIAHGTAHERSELFPDFIEKAETAAIGRAMAVAGYGTETAIELEEEGNLADAPVRTGRQPIEDYRHEDQGRQIVIEGSDEPNVRVGGRTANVTKAQINEIAKQSRRLKLGTVAASAVIETIIGRGPGFSDGDEEHLAKELLDFLQSLTNAEAASVIQVLMNAESKA